MSTDNLQMKIAFVFYEGPHDGAILSRLLRLNGFKNKTDMSMMAFPKPLNGFLKGRIKSFNYNNELKISQKPLLPNYIIKSETEDHKWFVFYAMGGDSNPSKPKEIIKSLKYDFAQDPELSFETQFAYSIAFFYDIDEGLESRMRKFKGDYNDILPALCDSWTQNYAHTIDGETANNDGFLKIGMFNYGVLDEDSNVMTPGTLEDILLPILNANSSNNLFEESQTLVRKHQKSLNENPTPKNRRKHNSDKGKAIIGALGQPLHPGRANAPIISDTKLITQTSLNADTVFSQIHGFLLNLIQ
jgi:hypothetical protein